MRWIVRALLVLAFTVSLSAQQRSVVFYWENDSLGSPFGQATDDDYTNGLRLGIGTVGQPRWAAQAQSLCSRFQSGCASLASSSSYAFTHQFYTPLRITATRQNLNDRPWAGFLALSANLQLSDTDQQHSLEVQLGILGQGAGAQYVQSKWHQLTGGPDPRGWRHQLKNEPVVNLLYGYSRRLHSDRVPYADAIVTPGFALGTLRTYPSAGATVRAGFHITGFPVPTLEQEAPRKMRLEETPVERPRNEIYAMAGVDARYVLHDSTLDGGFFRDGPSVEKIPFVHDFRVGFSARRDSFRLSYNLVMRSSEFEHLRGLNGNHNYHSLMLGWEPAP